MALLLCKYGNLPDYKKHSVVIHNYEMKPEEEAREKIDELLKLAGWIIQDYKDLNLSAGIGIAIREFPLKAGSADYLLFVNKQAVGVIEAKPIGTTLSGVSEQSRKYTDGVPEDIPHIQEPLPFAYESTGVETFFTDERDPDPRSRRIFAFHRPESLEELLSQEETLRLNLRSLPPLITEGLRECQIEAIVNLDKSFAESKPKALIQMASGAGKTYTAISFAYRLIKFADARRILFLVDRRTLGKQTLQEFQEYKTPDDGRKFTELYNIQHMTTNTIDLVSRVCITTIQRLYSMLKGEPEFDEELEEHSVLDFTTIEEKEKEVSYNPQIPIETFDFIITDECHRSIYNLWRQVLEYFDSFIIGLTATPSKQTLGFFDQNLVTEYNHERAIADNVNVGYDVYRIKTKISAKGSKIDAGFFVDKRDRLTRRIRWQQLDEDFEYESSQLDRSVVAPDQIRTIIKTFKDKLFTEIFPDRNEVPKTLIFAKSDSHAEDIVHIVREEFGKGNEFCEKITYKSTGGKPEDLIASFRNSYNPRIAVTVDMISTGTDIRPLECLIFMRDVKSRVYFEQMKGRGTRTITPTDLKSVTPDANYKTHFVIVDAVGVCESDKTDSRPLERKYSIPFDKLIMSVAVGKRDKDTLTSLAGRLARLDNGLTNEDRKRIEEISGGKPLEDIVNGLLDGVDPDKHIEVAKEVFETDAPSDKQIEEAAGKIIDTVCEALDNPQLRNLIIEIKQRSEQIIDTVSKDFLISSGNDEEAKEKAQEIVSRFKKFMEENKDELTALQIIYGKPYGQRHLTYEQIDQLRNAITKPPYQLTTVNLWKAYEKLEKSKVKDVGPQKTLTDIVSLVRFAIGEIDTLEPAPAIIERRFNEWLSEQERTGKAYNPEQLEWLGLIKDHIAANISIKKDDFEYVPFYEKGGLVKADKVFKGTLNDVLNELNEVLAIC